MRPSLSHPTIELRVADSCTRLADALAIAALFRCLVRALDKNPALNADFDRVGRAITAENKWHAQRHGLGATFVDPFSRAPLDAATWLASVRELDKRRWYLKLALWSLPLPWLAIELGWIVAEYGRQPWAIEGVLPTALGVSSVTAAQVGTSLAGFVIFYTALAVVDAILMVRYARKGPDGLGMWPEAATTSPKLAAAH